MRTPTSLALVAFLACPVIGCGDDSSPTDAGHDSSIADTGVADTGVVDSGSDSSTPDAGPADASTDAAPSDASLPDGAACVTEGNTAIVTPTSPSCCPDLTAISCSVPDDAGVCPVGPCTGASYCTHCGDGSCGLGENLCNCPADCAP